MSRRILKWDVPVDDREHEIGGGPVVHVASQYGKIDEVQVWTHEAAAGTPQFVTRGVRIYGTGQVLPEQSNPIGSAVVADGALVWHVVELS